LETAVSFRTGRLSVPKRAAVFAGHYVPNLALEVAKFNVAADAGERINIKGFMAGELFCSLPDLSLQ